MEFYQNTIVENKTKIILFFIYLVFSSGCGAKSEIDTIKNPELVKVNSSGGLTIKLDWPASKEEKYFYINTIDEDNTKSKKIEDVIDPSSFDYLYKDRVDKAKINNNYYDANSIDNHLKDKRYIYIYQHLNTKKPVFLLQAPLMIMKYWVALIYE